MEKADRVVAYYCFVWAVQSLLEKELHKKGKEEMNYAVQLMEHLEEVQIQNSKLANSSCHVVTSALTIHSSNLALRTMRR